MKRQQNINIIKEKLSYLITQIRLGGGLNLLDGHVHSESFYSKLLNLIFGWDLKNINLKALNTPGIDLIDTGRNIVVQVSSQDTKTKIQSALSKLKNYAGYNFKFIPIVEDASNLKGKTYTNPFKLVFDPSKDIFDIKFLMNQIMGMDIKKQDEICELLRTELVITPDPNKVESNLVAMIKILSQENISGNKKQATTRPFNVEKKITHNKLKKAKKLIDEYKLHSPRLNNIYKDFDKQGANKSHSILSLIQNIYLKLPNNIEPDDCFLKVIDEVNNKVINEPSSSIPEEEVLVCTNVLVVDAFIRCKIFENPEDK